VGRRRHPKNVQFGWGSADIRLSLHCDLKHDITYSNSFLSITQTSSVYSSTKLLLSLERLSHCFPELLLTNLVNNGITYDGCAVQAVDPENRPTAGRFAFKVVVGAIDPHRKKAHQ